MKTHDQTEVTLGMKNLKGLLVDTQKKDFHKKGLIEGVGTEPAPQAPPGDHRRHVWPAGFGPSSWRDEDTTVGSKDLVARGRHEQDHMGYEPKEVMITEFAAWQRLGEMDLEKIEVIGETIGGVASVSAPERG